MRRRRPRALRALIFWTIVAGNPLGMARAEGDLTTPPVERSARANEGLSAVGRDGDQDRRNLRDVDKSKAGPEELSRPSQNSEAKLGPSSSGRDTIERLFELAPPGSRQTVRTFVLFGLASLVPAGLLMVTAFVRIQIVLTLLRQAIGSPQIPGNQLLTALALLLTFVVMQPVGERIYREAIAPLAAGRLGFEDAVVTASIPVKAFMAAQVELTGHQRYLWALYEKAEPWRPDRVEPEVIEDFPIRVLAPAFLLSELTTALMMGFFIYLPFLVIDLVVSSVLAAMGLFMLPPASVAIPAKLILFVLADGWFRISMNLIGSFVAPGSSG